MEQLGFWELKERHQNLSKKKSFLDRVNASVPWDKFRPVLEEVHQK
jgi:hypothetical protein